VVDAQQLASARGTPVVLSAVLTRLNLHQTEPLIELARAWSARINFLPVGRIHARLRDLEPLIPEPREMRRAFADIAAHAAAGAPVLGSPASFEYLSHWPDPPDISCFAGRAMAKLSADGRLYPCAILEQRTSGPSALQSGFAAAFEELARDPLSCEGCWCTKTLQLNRLFWQPLSGVPYARRIGAVRSGSRVLF